MGITRKLERENEDLQESVRRSAIALREEKERNKKLQEELDVLRSKWYVRIWKMN